MDTLGMLLMGMGFSLLALSATMAVLSRKMQRNATENAEKFKDYVNSLKTFAEEMRNFNNTMTQAQAQARPIIPQPFGEGILNLRDTDGKLFQVEIVIDDAVDKVPVEAGWERIDDTTGVESKGSLSKAKRFIFSSQAAHTLNMKGIGLDDHVASLLREAGKIR